MAKTKMDVDFWNSIFQWGSVWLIPLTFVFGAGALITSNRIGDRQAAALTKAQTDLAAQRTELAKAQTELAAQREATAKAEIALEELRTALSPRTFRAETLIAGLAPLRESGVPEIIDLLYAENDGEAFRLADQLAETIRKAGLRASDPRPVPNNTSLTNEEHKRLGTSPNINQITRSKYALGGLFILASPDSPMAQTLLKALTACGLRVSMGADAGLGTSALRVVVGPNK